ncbi:MAG: nucleotide sugar dehydrogenase, partial [Actinomycetes bacterium]
MKVTVIGLGYLGATHAVAMAELGHEVIGIEANPERVRDLQDGVIPFFEPGLDDALKKVIAAGNITFKSDHDHESLDADIHFLCVGTPQLPGSYAANTSYLKDAVRALAPFLREDALVAGKSTVPVGTSQELTALLAAEVDFAPHLAWNPEFLREGTALEDSLRPDRIVIGVNDARSEELLREVYQSITDLGTPFLVIDIPTAELVKVAANSFLATKITFMNEIANVCELVGADVDAVRRGIGADDRIGKRFLFPGIGYGGSCFPK